MKTLLARWLFLAGVVIAGVSGCVGDHVSATALPSPPTPTPVTFGEGSTRAISHSLLTPQPIPTQIIEPGPSQMAETPVNDPRESASPEQEAAIRHEVTATVDYAAHTVTANQQVSFRNDTGRALDELVFNVAPNQQPGAFLLEDVLLGDDDVAVATLEGVRLTIQLPTPLQADCRQEVGLTYALNVPQMGTGLFPRRGYFGYSDRQFNLSHWLLTIAHFDGESWITPLPVTIGEQDVLTAADFHVALTVENAPENLTVVGSGNMRQEDDTWFFDLPAARDLPISLSDQYHRLAGMSPNGIQVEVYTLDDAQPLPNATFDGPAHALDTAATALELYSDLYGPYPYDRFVVIQSAFPDGMEFSGLVFVGGEWFRAYDGDPASYLTLITAHEVSHQWWYGRVANNQSTTPWLDEALATYSELIFLQENYPQLIDWWWYFRVDAYSPRGRVDRTVYRFENTRAYINAVYLRGAQMMHELRQDLGGEAFFAWLHDYVEAMDGQIATPNDLWAVLPRSHVESTYAIREHYLRDPGRAAE